MASGLVKHGYETRIASRTAGKLREFTARTGIAEGTFADVGAADRDGSLSRAVRKAVALLAPP